MKRKLCVLSVFVVIMLMFTACSKDISNSVNTEDYVYNSIKIYYVNSMINELNPKTHVLAAKTTTEQVEEVMSLLMESTGDNSYKVPFDREVVYNGYSFNNSILTIDFNSEYLKMDEQRELLSRAALVLSLVQLDGVSYVNITIDSQPLTDPSGRIISNMNEQTFADVVASGGSISNSINLTLYFADESGEKLVPVKTALDYDEVNSVERIVVDALIKGPDSLERYTVSNADDPENPTYEKVYQVMGEDVGVVSATTKNGICYVDFDEEFIKQNVGVSNEVIIYSIVNSLCELNFVSQVQISVLGDSQIDFHGTVSIRDPFIRNLNIVKN